MSNLDEYEKDLLLSVESGEWQSKADLKDRTKELQGYIKNSKKRSISIRINENDLYLIKKKALENSLPYQNLLQMIIHQFATDRVKIEI